MSIICISRGSYFRGRDVAIKVAEKLGYTCISRDSLLDESEEFDIPELKLMRNIQHAPQLLERYSFGRERYVNFISSSILGCLKKDNHVYHGIAGQFFFYDVSHLLKVRVIADFDDRVEAEAAREGITPDQARMQLKHDDEERQKWAMMLYGIDIVDPGLYDMVLNLSTMSVDDAADLIVKAAEMPCYQATEESLKKIERYALIAEIKAALFDFPRAGVHALEDKVQISVKAPEEQSEAVVARVQEAIKNVEGLKEVDIRVAPYF